MFAARRILTAPAVRRSATARTFRSSPRLCSPGYSSFSEAEASLFKPLGDSSAAEPLDAQLREDVRTMGALLGKIIQDHHGSSVYDKVETMRNLAKTWRGAGAGRETLTAPEAAEAFGELSDFAASLKNDDLFWVSRAFTHFLGIANAAERHHRSRLLQLKEGTPGALSDKSDSCGGVLPALTEEHGSDKVWEALTTQTVELVLTAHPTEVNRRTILDKKQRVEQILTQADLYRDIGRTTPYQQDELNDALHREIASMWQSDEVSRAKPTPVDEAERGTMVVETVLWEAVPQFLRRLDATMEASLGKGLPLESAPIRFASWMGGDRDGNPNVTADVTREVCLAKRSKAASMFSKDVAKLHSELSITNCSDELRAVVGTSPEPYRALLQPMIKKLGLTKQWADERLERLHEGRVLYFADNISMKDIYLGKSDLMEDLLLIHRSLCSTGNETTANGFLSDVIRNLAAFGLTLVPLDIRQESDRHAEALDCICRSLGLGSYEQWDEQTRIGWLTQQLASPRPLIRSGDWNKKPDIFTPTAVDTLETFEMISEMNEGSLGAYVISQATSASDVLAVLLLQRDAGVKNPLRVAPLFETLDDLNGATETMDALFKLPAYMGAIGGKQEVMIGYSDSAKDAGRLAASWAQYETQEKLAEVARKHSVEMTFFHGKGGTVGRGGNPATFTAIMAHAPDTINGQFRVTEQGEMINQNFGHDEIAERTMDIYTAAVLAEKMTERPRPGQEWRDMMAKLSDISCDAYRRIVRGDERFVPFFRKATPELELSSLNIGSRPAKRKATGGVESLRAIPWNFSWTQTRLNLPTWLGVGEAVGEVLKSEDADVLREMYKDWGSFRTTIDLVEMVLAKSEPSIAAHYEDTLVTDPKAKELGAEVRSLHTATEEAVLDLTEHKHLSENNKLLNRILVVRNPYVDCLNVLQAETLKRLRAQEEGKEDKVLQDALMTTITGVANGMGNTG